MNLLSAIRINHNDKIIEEFADFIVKLVKEGADINPKNEKNTINLNSYPNIIP